MEVLYSMEPIKIRGLKQNNLKNISLEIPKNKIVVLPESPVRESPVSYLIRLQRKASGR